MKTVKETTWSKGFHRIEIFPRVQFRHGRKCTELRIAWVLWGISLTWDKEEEK